LRYLNTIRAATVEMGRLIDDLLDFSRMGRIELSRGEVPLDRLVEDSLRGFELAVRDREIEWKIDPLPEVIGDSSMLKHVLTNLIDNALKYSRNAHPARIEIGSAGQEDGRVVLFVRDNGAGFDMRYVHKLFGVFQRLHRSEEYEGTGIGLATVRRIISRHGGRAWAEGEVENGATIFFTLQPVASE
jgi:light-regulated signal transduction histidine kinase (bacteriophytochrome)